MIEDESTALTQGRLSTQSIVRMSQLPLNNISAVNIPSGTVSLPTTFSSTIQANGNGFSPIVYNHLLQNDYNVQQELRQRNIYPINAVFSSEDQTTNNSQQLPVAPIETFGVSLTFCIELKNIISIIYNKIYF